MNEKYLNDEHLRRAILAIQNNDLEIAKFFLCNSINTYNNPLAKFQLGSLHAQALFSPYDLDLAYSLLKDSAESGEDIDSYVNDSVTPFVNFVERIDDNEVCFEEFSRYIAELQIYNNSINPYLMIASTHYYDHLIKNYDLLSAVIKWELCAMSYTEDPAVSSFLKRFGLPEKVYKDGMFISKQNPLYNELDHVTDELNEFIFITGRRGYSQPQFCFMKCNIVGYLYNKYFSPVDMYSYRDFYNI